MATVSFLKKFTIQLLGTNRMATAALQLLDSLKIKSEPLEIPLSADAGVGKKLEETIVPRWNYNLAIQHFPKWVKQLSVTHHMKMH